ncbi:RNA polymerase sigma-70 factor (ECF subfamily) [Sphingomonas vulcanisoli]|uniref:RNA polymerase sigma-70 factor (ECF subfamily) n=1 Tax=Sphingomonas vulcanisoli TaxID=1658060 RepID=A0ABX0TS94_9SPHN|nr:sigma-70 family RNA polymerase sigma factor [Sphingomonas vulcanisoli]NIJ08393.1 RNA polymerase sigma-70 factor (ECF subfamily) [Sphingomonas vulcanisoli]
MIAAGPPETRASLNAALQQVAQGDRLAFEEVYRRTSAKLFGVCLRILPDRTQAEEALQEAYLSVWQRAAQFDAARGTAMTWLISLTRNRAIDRLRAGGRHVAAPIEAASDVHDDKPDGLAMAEMAEDERRLAGCMGGLEARDAVFLRTAFFDGASYPELAERSGLPLATLKSRIRRALLKLRDCLA